VIVDRYDFSIAQTLIHSIYFFGVIRKRNCTQGNLVHLLNSEQQSCICVRKSSQHIITCLKALVRQNEIVSNMYCIGNNFPCLYSFERVKLVTFFVINLNPVLNLNG
jgi:hypothetical protein